MLTQHPHKDSLIVLASLAADLATGNQATKSNAFQEILSMAEQGNAEAMYQVARCLRQGLGVDQNEDVGDYWLRRACASTPASPHALLVLGMQHYLQQRPDSNPKQGLAMIEQSAAAGFSYAVVKLSKLYEEGGALFVPDIRRAYRVLATAFDGRQDFSIVSAYDGFVQRHSPINHLLDS